MAASAPPLLPNGVVTPPTAAVATPAVAEDVYCKETLQTILEIAIRVLVPFVTALTMYFTLPLSVSTICIPIATVATVFAMTFFFAKKEPVEPPLPLTRTAPLGLRNSGGNDCWLNSLVQMLRIDKPMRKWFTNVPANLNIHIGYFRYFTQNLLENLPAVLPPTAYVNLDNNGRATIDRYANFIRGMNQEERLNLFSYLKFLRRDETTAVNVANALLEFKKFMVTYDEGERNAPGQVLMALPAQNQAQAPARPPEPETFNSHRLRMAIATVCPNINLRVPYQQETYHDNTQQDVDEAFPVIFSYFLPDDLKAVLQERRYYNLPRSFPDDDHAVGNRLTRAQNPEVPMLRCAIQGSYPNAENFLERYWEETHNDPDNRLTRQIGGVEYHFQLLKTEMQYLTAPSSLWLLAKRYERINPKWVGLHRMMPDWFHAAPADQYKIKTAVEFQEILEIRSVDGALTQYRLDGFICQEGETIASGHYISYRFGVDDEGRPAYFKMNDSRVSRLSEAQMLAALETAYVVHYSKPDNQEQ